MILKYTSYFLVKEKKKIKNIYINSFNKDERFSFLILEKCAKEKNVEFNVVYDNNDLIGFYYIVNYDDVSYLMYFAVDITKRNKGYGSMILSDLTKKHNNILLCIEFANKNVNDEKLLRRNFYLKNGFFSSNKFIIDNNVKYEILTTNKDYSITEEVLRKRYVNMTKSKFIKLIIRKKFNVDNIVLGSDNNE